MKNIEVNELKEMLEANVAVRLVDVREAYEHDAFNIGGTLMPLGEIMMTANQIPTNEKVVLYCRKGIRSAIAIQRLEERFGFDNLYNLTGGMDAWQKMD